MALVYNEENLVVEDPGIAHPEGIEAVWLILTPKNTNWRNIYSTKLSLQARHH